MALTFDNAIYQQNGNQDHSITITLAANAVLFAFVEILNGGAAFSAMDLGGAPMNSVGGANTAHLFAWVCSSPPTGITTFRLGLTGLFQHGVALVSYTGAPTSGQYGSPAPNSSGAASNYNISVSSTTTDFVVHAVRVSNAVNAAFANNGTTRLSGTCSGLSRLIIADQGGASSITLSCTVQTAAASWDSVSIPLHAAAGGVTLVGIKMMLSVGL
jgi:hypothetical protein